MWKQSLEIGKQIFGLMRKSQQHDDDIRALRQEVKEIHEELHELSNTVRWLVIAREHDREVAIREREHDRDVATRDRDNLLLRLENALLRFERGLPPGRQGEGPLDAP